VSFAPVEEGDVEGEEVTPAIDVGGGQGIQAGTGNVQYNTWASKPPSDLASLSALHPHVAVARLQRLSHDEMVDLFARASPDDATDVIAAFWEADAAAVVAILGDISRRKATELIKSFVPGSHVLASLPEAVEAIAGKAKALKWTHAGDAGTLEHFADGYVRKYKNGGGRVLWSRAYGAHSVSGAIEEFWTRNKELLEFPEGDAEDAQKSPFGTVGIRQSFAGITAYSSERGVSAVDWVYAPCYEGEGGCTGWLGFPIGRDSGDQASGYVQHFEVKPAAS
jgi:hypothetical protein